MKRVKKTQLGKLEKGKKAIITSVGSSDCSNELTQRLMEMGFLEGALVEILYAAPWGGDPIAIRVRGALIALRRQEANAIEVMVDDKLQY